MAKYRVVHYINHLFAQIGGEEKADHRPEAREGFVGPGMAFNAAFGDSAEIVERLSAAIPTSTRT